MLGLGLGLNKSSIRVRIKKYTVQFTGDSLTGTRLDNAVGMVANVAVDDELVRNDFDNVPFYNRPMCNVYFDAEGYPHVMAYRGRRAAERGIRVV